MNEKLAIDGGTPVFQPGELDSLIPSWPIPHKETEEKLLEVFRSGKWGHCAKYEKLLMEEFPPFQDAKYSAWMINGTTTLECAQIALGIGPGDEVIVPAVSWIATAETPVYVGATPVLVDIDPETLCIDPAKIEEAITPRTKAIIPVHLFSAVADMKKINEIARKHNLFVIEDAAHAHGAKQNGKGLNGDIASFSFQLSKLMTGGEGGCCITNDPELGDRLFRISHIGASQMNPKVAPQQGMMCHQYRFTDFQAAIICDQLHHAAEFRDKRAKAVARIVEQVKDIPSVKLQKSSYPDDLRAYYFFTWLLQSEYLKPGIDRAYIFKALRAEGILLHEGWGMPIYKMPSWNVRKELYRQLDTRVSEEVMANRLMCTLQNMLLADNAVLDRWAAAFRKVMLSVTKQQ